MRIISSEIGFIENKIGRDQVLLWFYKKRLGTWVRIASYKLNPLQLRLKLDEVSTKAILVPLGRGT